MRESGLLRYARNNDVHSIATLFWVSRPLLKESARLLPASLLVLDADHPGGLRRNARAWDRLDTTPFEVLNRGRPVLTRSGWRIMV